MLKKSQTPRKKATRQELRDMDQEILFLEGLVRRDANYVEALQILGDDYTRRGSRLRRRLENATNAFASCARTTRWFSTIWRAAIRSRNSSTWPSKLWRPP